MKPRGVTLIEVICSVVIIGISFSILAQGLISASQASSTSQAYTRAVQIATQKITEVAAGQYTLNMDIEETIEDEIYTFDVHIRPGAGPRSGLSEVVVEVTWQMRGTDRTVSMTRYVHDSLRPQE
jgi:prepilin-type N-terminal cleavage/methylation domain-containing protein